MPSKIVAANVSASDGLVAGVDVTWAQPGNTKSAQVWRFDANGNNGVLIGTVPRGPYHDAAAIAGVHYKYGIRLQGPTGPFGALSALNDGYAATLPPPPPPPLTITTQSIDAAQVGVPCSDTLEASGGKAPLVWSIASGSLPGMALAAATGVYAGTPTASGLLAVEVKVTDANGVSVTKAYTVSIATADPPPPAGMLEMPPATSLVNSEGKWTIAANGVAQLNGANSSAAWGPLTQVGDTIIALGAANICYQHTTYPGNPADWGNTSHVDTLFPKAPWAWFPIPDDPRPAIQNAPSGYAGSLITPDLWEHDFTSYEALCALAGYDLNASSNDGVHWAYNPEFLTDPATGLRYLRVSNDPTRLGFQPNDGGCAYFAAFLPFLPGTINGKTFIRLFFRYLVYFEDDIAPAFNDPQGAKLPGLTGENGFRDTTQNPELLSLRTFHRAPIANTFALSDYGYDAEQAKQAQYPPQPYTGAIFRTKRWHVVDQEVGLNSVANGVGASDGIKRLWLDGRLVFEQTNRVYRNDAASVLRAVHFNYYHGGHCAPIALTHIRFAKLAVGTVGPIGAPKELLAGVPTSGGGPTTTTGPAWRKGRAIGQFAPIPGTAMSLLAGVDSLTIDGYQGLASTDDSVVSSMAGGHNGFQNGTHELGIMVDAPAWITRNPGSPFSAVQTDALRAGPPPLYRYADGLPCGSQLYSWLWFVRSLDRFVRLFIAAPHNLVPGPLNRIHSIRRSDWKYDPEGTWADGLIWNGAYHSTAAQDPLTGCVYIGNEYGEHFKWDPSQVSATSHGFSRLLIPGNPIFGYGSSFVDTKRRRWARLGGGIAYIDLADLTVHSIPASGDPNWANDYGNVLANEPPGSVYDPDRDLYLGLCNNGRVYAIGPDDAKGAYVQTLADIPFQNTPTTSNGWNTRVKHLPSAGGILCVPRFDANAHFMPTQ